MISTKSRQLSFALTAWIFLFASQQLWADYLGTLSNRPFLDPASVPVIIDGYQAGDIISFIGETTPNPSHSPVGAGAWTTFYLPAGALVVNAEIVTPNPDGTYSGIPMSDVSNIADQCGPRGCNFPTSGTLQNGRLNEGQQDTGVFFSTDPQTAKLPTPLSISPTGSKIKPQDVHNQWDYNQTLAFGVAAALSGNSGKGNIPLVQIGGTWFGAGSPVAGPDTFFTNDYDPSCNAANDFELDISCAGPWQRIKYANAKKSGTGSPAPVVVAGGNLVNNSVVTFIGHDFAVDGALPSNTNAVRLVFGERRIGELEYVRITFQLTDATAFTNAINDGDVCVDATGGDTDKPDRGPQDNNWRYYEGNAQACFTGSSGANLLKTVTHVDNVAGGGTVQADSVIGYTVSFYNTGSQALYDLQLSDTPIDTALTLLAPGSTDCPYASYNSGEAGGPTFSGIAGNTATWSTMSSLAAGEGITVYMCAQVPNDATFGDIYKNEGTATYATSSGGTTEPALEAIATVVVSSKISGFVLVDEDSSGTQTTGDVGIVAATVQLWVDANGDGALGGGDTLFDSQLTNTAGGYTFNGLEANNYLVVEQATGYLSYADSDTTAANCATGNGCDTIAVTLAADGASTGNNFANIGAVIGDLVYSDADGNGSFDNADTGIESITVDLLDSGANVIATTSTDANGFYSFRALAAASYSVVITDTAGLLVPGVLHNQTQDPDATLDASTAVNPSAGQSIADADFGYQPLVVELIKVKSVSVLNDPINGTTNPKAIPGAELLYTISLSNQGNGPLDSDSLVITDLLPVGISLFVGDLNGVGSGPVTLSQSPTVPSNVTYSYTDLNSATDNLEFSVDSGVDLFQYQPTSVAGYDSSVNALRLNLGGSMDASDGSNHPAFNLTFKVRLD